MLNAREPDTPLRTTLTRAGMIALPFGPSLGLFYAGAVNRGITGIGLRLAGMGVMYGAVVLAFDSSSAGPALLFGLGGAALVFVSSLADISAAGRYVRRRNEEIRQKTLDIAPVISPASRMIGIQIRLSF
jgi:hypothetical protein